MKYLLLLLFLVPLTACQQYEHLKQRIYPSEFVPITMEAAYAEAVKTFGEAEEIEIFFIGDFTVWYCWYWSRGFEFNITKLDNKHSAELDFYQMFRPYPFGYSCNGRLPPHVGTYIHYTAGCANG